MFEDLCLKALPVSVMNGEGVTGKTDGETLILIIGLE